MRYDDYLIMKMFLVARNITFVGIIIGVGALCYGRSQSQTPTLTHEKYKIARNYYKVGIVFISLFVLLRILVTFAIIKQMQKYRTSMCDYLTKNMNINILVIISLNILKIIGFTVVLVSWLENINHIVFVFVISGCTICISWGMLIFYQCKILEIYAQKISYTRVSVPNEESPFNIHIYRRTSYV